MGMVWEITREIGCFTRGRRDINSADGMVVKFYTEYRLELDKLSLIIPRSST